VTNKVQERDISVLDNVRILNGSVFLRSCEDFFSGELQESYCWIEAVVLAVISHLGLVARKCSFQCTFSYHLTDLEISSHLPYLQLSWNLGYKFPIGLGCLPSPGQHFYRLRMSCFLIMNRGRHHGMVWVFPSRWKHRVNEQATEGVVGEAP
jgi:hypothetical protein